MVVARARWFDSSPFHDTLLISPPSPKTKIMHIFLAGPAGPEQVATKWLLQQRGYDRVVCESDLLMKDYCYNRGTKPSPRDFRRYRSLELAQATVCVLAEDLAGAHRTDVIGAARYAGIPVLPYDQLPSQAPSIMREDEVLDAIICEQEAAQQPLLQRVSAWMDRAAKQFEARFGWFFTNGHKAAMRAEKRYPEMTNKPQTTA